LRQAYDYWQDQPGNYRFVLLVLQKNFCKATIVSPFTPTQKSMSQVMVAFVYFLYANTVKQSESFTMKAL